MNDNCPDLQPNPTTEVSPRPSKPTLIPPTTMFGPWMVVEKRQRHPQPKEAAGRGTSNNMPITESCFTPILDANIDDPLPPALRVLINAQSPPELARPSTTSQPAAPKRISKSKSAPPKHTSVLMVLTIKFA
ncbi:hypothetical protein V6N13_039817 [Hibiscus sabdariffa]